MIQHFFALVLGFLFGLIVFNLQCVRVIALFFQLPKMLPAHRVVVVVVVVVSVAVAYIRYL